jgi:hypothetical protein
MELAGPERLFSYLDLFRVLPRSPNAGHFQRSRLVAGPLNKLCYLSWRGLGRMRASRVER